jgi:hypothetical protein
MKTRYGTNSKDKIVAPIILEQHNLFEFILIAIILAFGVNFVTDSLTTNFDFHSRYELIIGIFLCLSSAIYFFIRFFGKRQQTRVFNAFFVYDKRLNSLVDVPRYDFAENITRYINSAFAENEALKTAWTKEPLSKIWEREPNKENKTSKVLRSKNMISEVVEYYVLEKLSTNLTDYFNNNVFSKRELQEFNRKDIPDVILSNRFLELFSKPREDRPQFVEDTFEEDNLGVVVMSGGKDGAFYSRLDLILPNKSSVHRPEPHTIQINTGRIIITIKIKFDGISYNLPAGFHETYLGISNHLYYSEFITFRVDTEIKSEFKFGALLSASGWDYYHWVDSFLDCLNDDLSSDEFFGRLNWENAYTTYMLQHRNNKNDVLPNDSDKTQLS